MKTFNIKSQEEFDNLPKHILEDDSRKTIINIEADKIKGELNKVKNCKIKGEEETRLLISELTESRDICFKNLTIQKLSIEDSGNIQFIKDEIIQYLRGHNVESIRIEKCKFYNLYFSNSSNINIINCNTWEEDRPLNLIRLVSSEKIKIEESKLAGDVKKTKALSFKSTKDINIKNVKIKNCDLTIDSEDSKVVFNNSKIDTNRRMNINNDSTLNMKNIEIKDLEDYTINKDPTSKINIDNSPELCINII